MKRAISIATKSTIAGVFGLMALDSGAGGYESVVMQGLTWGSAAASAGFAGWALKDLNNATNFVGKLLGRNNRNSPKPSEGNGGPEAPSP